MKRSDIERNLRALGQKLLVREVTGEILIVGGAYMVPRPGYGIAGLAARFDASAIQAAQRLHWRVRPHEGVEAATDRLRPVFRPRVRSRRRDVRRRTGASVIDEVASRRWPRIDFRSRRSGEKARSSPAGCSNTRSGTGSTPEGWARPCRRRAPPPRPVGLPRARAARARACPGALSDAIRTLDALHLASIEWLRSLGQRPRLATYKPPPGGGGHRPGRPADQALNENRGSHP